ncbi:substrate-binding periplasmic protein [Thalassotalea sediminis]|uniref:substrate-binding periplasmic protein n=1 Tax=Thalassotalea sediminis TaxID=1759089 RepID=UPI0025726406|nr:transporter substrate-binding domain-containing protein [Thalassotalea sediminis]
MKSITLKLTLSALLLNVHLAFAQDSELTFATMEQLPYGFTKSPHKKSGMLYEMLELIRQGVEVNAEHQLLPVKRLTNYLHSNKPTCSLIVNTYDYIEKFTLVAPINIYLNAGVVVKKTTNDISRKNLSSLTIAVPLGLKISKEFDQNPSLKKIYPPRYKNALEMFKHNTVDGIAGAIPTILYLAKQKDIQLSSFAKPIVYSTGKLYLVCNNNVDEKIKKQLAENVKQLKQQRAFKKITEKYFDDSAKNLWAMRR